MNIPQVNAAATDRNREQTKRICELAGWTIDAETFRGPVVVGDPAKMLNEKGERISQVENLPNGSFTLCQVVGMLERKHVYFERHHQVQSSSTVEGWYFAQWGEPGKADREMLLLKIGDPHDLTDAMDALIKVLEAKP